MKTMISILGGGLVCSTEFLNCKLNHQIIPLSQDSPHFEIPSLLENGVLGLVLCRLAP